MILRCSFEEMKAVQAGARVALTGLEGHRTAVAAPPSVREDIDHLTANLDGDLALSTLEEQRTVERALRSVVGALRAELEVAVVASHPAAEPAVSACCMQPSSASACRAPFGSIGPRGELC